MNAPANTLDDLVVAEIATRSDIEEIRADLREFELRIDGELKRSSFA